MLNELREATRELHEKIEGENLAGLIVNHSISLEEYKLLLLQNYIAYYVAETALAKKIPGYQPSKYVRLKKDLEKLRVNTSVLADYKDSFECGNYFEALGALYVVEGSSMGGMIIARELDNCENLAAVETHHFFNGDRGHVKSFNALMKQLNSDVFSEKEKEQAVKKARETFEFFGKVFRLKKLPEQVQSEFSRKKLLNTS